MNVEVLVRLEPVDDGKKIGWWATAPAVGNVAVAATTLRDLEPLAMEAVHQAAVELGLPKPTEVTFTLVEEPQPSAGDDLPAERQGATTPAGAGVEGGQRSARLVPA